MAILSANIKCYRILEGKSITQYPGLKAQEMVPKGE